MPITLIVDDDTNRLSVLKRIAARMFPRTITFTANSYNSAIKILSKRHEDIHVLFLDHDLGSEKTGYDIAKTILENGWQIPKIFVHSINPVGARKICGIMQDKGTDVKAIPFTSLQTLA